MIEVMNNDPIPLQQDSKGVVASESNFSAAFLRRHRIVYRLHVGYICLAMTDVLVRVLELRTEEHHSALNNLRFSAETRSSKRPLESKVQGGTFLKAAGSWKFSIPSQTSEMLSIILTKRRIFSRNKVVGRCVLPLAWFPTNYVVREWFPMINDLDPPGTDATTMILLDVHVDTRRCRRFRAAFSNLRVIPTWHRPAGQFSECPAPPQVIYVIQEPNLAPGEPPRYLPVGSAQYPSPQLIQFGAPPPPPQFAGLQGPGWRYGGSNTSLGSIPYPSVSIMQTPNGDPDVPPVYA
jgi:hypothetical protein